MDQIHLNGLLQQCLRQDRRAQKALYEICYKQFIRLCMTYNSNHEDARFALNNAFLKIINGLESVDHNNLNFYSWAKRIIVNSLIDDYRRNKNHAELIVTKDSESAIEFHATPTVNEADSSLSYNEIMGLLKTIPPISAHVFTLYVIDGYNHREIGELLEITEGTSKWHLSTARKLLRDRLHMMEQQTEKQFNL